MANYTKLTNFASKDALATGNPLKIIKGTEIDDEFESLETAIATKVDSASPTLTGTVTIPTPAASSNTTVAATTAFVKTVISTGGYVATAGIADNAITNAKMADDSVGSAELIDNSVGAAALNVSGNGTAGQVLKTDGDGSFTWVDQDAGITTTTGSPDYYAARAWVNFNGTGTVAIRASQNTSSITDQGTGKYRVNFTTAMPDINYAAMGSCGKPDNVDDQNSSLQVGNAGNATLQTTSYTYVRSGFSTGSIEDVNIIGVSVFR